MLPRRDPWSITPTMPAWVLPFGSVIEIVSDIHIDGPDDPAYLSLLSWLDSMQPLSGGAEHVVVLAGDIFDFWVGANGDEMQRYVAFVQSLRRLGERGVRVHYIEGNHDFALHRTIGAIRGVVLHASGVTFFCGRNKIRVEHGDLADETDEAYLRLRAVLRSRWLYWWIGVLPGWVARAIGRALSSYTKSRSRTLPSEWSEDALKRLRRRYRDRASALSRGGFTAVVLGHCHDLDAWDGFVNDTPIRYMNVGFPKVHGMTVRWLDDGYGIRRGHFGPPMTDPTPPLPRKSN